MLPYPVIGWLQFLVQITQKTSFATVTRRGSISRYDCQDRDLRHLWENNRYWILLARLHDHYLCKIDVGQHWDKQTTSKHLMPHTQSEDFFMLVVLAILSSILLTNDRFQELFGSVLGLICETHTNEHTISRVHGWSNLPRTQGVTSKVIQWGLKNRIHKQPVSDQQIT